MATPDDTNDENDAGHAGHRARLRQQFLTAGAEALADYELLELLLFLAKPRGDVKPLAKRLIARFGSVAKPASSRMATDARSSPLDSHSLEVM